MKNSEIELLERISLYLKIHNNTPLYTELNILIDKIKATKERDNARKLKFITEKRKINKEYGGHGRKSSNK